MDNRQEATGGGGQGHVAQDPQGQGHGGQDPQGQVQGGQDPQKLRQERIIRETIDGSDRLFKFREKPYASKYWLKQYPVRHVLDTPRLGPGERDTIELTLIIPGPYKKFRVIAALTVEALTVDIFSNTADDFPLQEFELMWGKALMGVVTQPGATRQLRLGQGAIWAVALSNASLTLFFENHETDFRCMVVLIPQDDFRKEQRTRLAAFGLTLCRWIFSDDDQLVHENPKYFVTYEVLMERARGSDRLSAWSDGPWPVPHKAGHKEEDGVREQGLFDTELHYLYRPNLPLLNQDHLYRHLKYEMKKALAIVAHRLFTRLERSKERLEAEGGILHPAKNQYGQIQDRILREVYSDMGTYFSITAQYGIFYRMIYDLFEFSWDDPANRNHVAYVPLSGPTVWADPPKQYVRWVEAQGQYVPVYQLLDYTHPAFRESMIGFNQTYPMRVYWSLVDRWHVVERVEYHDTHLLVYVERSSAHREHCLKITYENILYVRHCTLGPTKSFSIHQHLNHWGHLHFECELSNEIIALRDLFLSHLQEHAIAWSRVAPEQDVNRQIGPISRALFPNDPTIEPEPALYWRVGTEAASADTEIGKNYLSLACRLINKLAIQMVHLLEPNLSNAGEFKLENDHVLNMWKVYWHSRKTILPQSRQHSNLPHLVRLDQVFRMRHRWLYATLDAPNER